MNNKNTALKKWVIITVCCALVAFIIPIVGASFMADDANPVVIVLDPGHGGTDVGAVNYTGGLYESDLNLAIALACYDELQKYDGIEVHLTHSGISYGEGSMSLEDRVAYANEVNADMLISLHCNDASSPEANGSEVYVSHSTYKQSYNQDSTELGICFLRRFRSMGLTIRGVKTRLSDGSRMYYHDGGWQEIGDYYAVIGDTIKQYGIPGILVEHGFVTGDAQYFDTAEKLQALGAADAWAIAEYYGLKLKNGGSSNSPVREAVIVTDEEIISASDVSNSILSLPQICAPEHEYILRDIKARYEKMSDAAQSLVEKEQVDFLYHSLLDIDSRNHPVRIASVDEARISVNRFDSVISGIDIQTGELSGTNVSQLMSELEWYIDVNYAQIDKVDASAYRIEVLDMMGAPMDIGAPVTTGCIVRLMNGYDVLDQLYTVIYGDIDGDGRIDSFDQLVLEDHLVNGTELTPAAAEAADVNNDGRVDGDDIEYLAQLIIKLG